MNPSEVVAILTAAGRSSRMRRAKALLEWGGRPLIQHQVEALVGAGLREAIVVLGCDAHTIRPFVPTGHTVRVIEHAGWEEGRTSSLRAGFAAVSGAPQGIMVVAVDQPLPPGVVTALLQGHRPEAAVAQPAYQGQRGHPVLFRGDLLAELRAIEEASEGLRAVVARHRERRQEIAVTDPEVLLDLNLPADYARYVVAPGR